MPGSKRKTEERMERKGTVLLVRCCSSSTELDGSDAETEVSGAGG